MATAKKRRERRESFDEPSPEPGKPAKTQALSRKGLWVVNSGRMKQYGDYVIEGPGQIIRQQYLRNDDVLLKLGYVRPLKSRDETTQCKACGLVFLGTLTVGPYKAHLAAARHDLAQTDLDSGTTRPDGRKRRVGDESDPDSDSGGDWDLEPEGAPAPSKLEEESPSGVRVSM